MHETHLIQPIIKKIAAQAEKEGTQAVLKVRVKIGDLTGVTADSFKETFSMLARDTILENAELEITVFPGTQIEVLSFDIN